MARVAAPFQSQPDDPGAHGEPWFGDGPENAEGCFIVSLRAVVFVVAIGIALAFAFIAFDFSRVSP